VIRVVFHLCGSDSRATNSLPDPRPLFSGWGCQAEQGNMPGLLDLLKFRTQRENFGFARNPPRMLRVQGNTGQVMPNPHAHQVVTKRPHPTCGTAASRRAARFAVKHFSGFEFFLIALSYGYAPDHSTIASFVSPMQNEISSQYNVHRL